MVLKLGWHVLLLLDPSARPSMHATSCTLHLVGDIGLPEIISLLRLSSSGLTFAQHEGL